LTADHKAFREDLTMKRIVTLAAATLVLAGAPTALAQAASPWLHIRVEESRGKAQKVSVNLPMSIVHAALEAAPEKVIRKGRIHLRGHHDEGDLDVADFRRIWAEIKKTGDTDFVTVEEEDETVSVAKKGDRVQVRVDKRDGSEQVRIDLPTSVVDAFFSAEGEEVDLKAAMTEIAKLRGDVVRVTDRDTSVRIWIDDQGSQR
jgi:hypothetical protein